MADDAAKITNPSHYSGAAASVSGAAAVLDDFNEKCDAALSATQPLMTEYVALLRTLRAEVASVSSRAAACLARAKAVAARGGVDISKLPLGEHQAALDDEERAELVVS